MTWGRFKGQENKAVSPDRADPQLEIQPGDLLVSRANTIDYVEAPVLVGPTRPRLLLSDKSLRLVPRNGIDARWLIAVLAAPAIRRQISKLATETKDSMRNISQASLLSVVVPSASVSEQQRVVDGAAAIGAAAKATEACLRSTELRVTHLHRALLTAAFSGRLTGCAADDDLVRELADV